MKAAFVNTVYGPPLYSTVLAQSTGKSGVTKEKGWNHDQRSDRTIALLLDSGKEGTMAIETERRVPQGFLTDKHIRFLLKEDRLMVANTWDESSIRHATYTL